MYTSTGRLSPQRGGRSWFFSLRRKRSCPVGEHGGASGAGRGNDVQPRRGTNMKITSCRNRAPAGCSQPVGDRCLIGPCRGHSIANHHRPHDSTDTVRCDAQRGGRAYRLSHGNRRGELQSQTLRSGHHIGANVLVAVLGTHSWPNSAWGSQGRQRTCGCPPGPTIEASYAGTYAAAAGLPVPPITSADAHEFRHLQPNPGGHECLRHLPGSLRPV